MTGPPLADGQVQGGLGDGLAEWRCPSCGAVTRALMADRQDEAAEQWVSYQIDYDGDGMPVRRRRVVAGPWEPVRQEG